MRLLKDKYFEYDIDIYKDIHKLKEKIHKIEHLKTLAKRNKRFREKNNNISC